MSEKKTAIVTGASRGIGRAIAVSFVKAGFDVALIATRRTEESDALVRELRAMGQKVSFYPCDVSKMEEVTTVIAAIEKEYEHIDILVNNAGITRDGLLLRMSEEDFTRVLDVNLGGTFHMTKACLRSFVKQRSGKIINISSVVGMMGNAGQANYAASKAAVIGLTKSVAREYAGKGITCNAVAPGYIKTQMTEELSEQVSETIRTGIPMRRFGTAEDVAGVVLFLASDAAAYLTGDVIRVDGGMYI